MTLQDTYECSKKVSATGTEHVMFDSRPGHQNKMSGFSWHFLTKK